MISRFFWTPVSFTLFVSFVLRHHNNICRIKTKRIIEKSSIFWLLRVFSKVIYYGICWFILGEMLYFNTKKIRSKNGFFYKNVFFVVIILWNQRLVLFLRHLVLQKAVLLGSWKILRWYCLGKHVWRCCMILPCR